MSRKAKVLLGFGIYLAVIVAVLLIFGNDGENESFQPQNEFKLEPWVDIKIAGIDMSINKAVLYLVLASAATAASMVYIAKRMAQKPNRTQTAVELAYDLTKNNITGGNLDGQDGRQVVPLHRHPLLLDLVLEHARLPAAAHQHRAHLRPVRGCGARRSRSTQRRPTSRSRWC